jgi:hypothetical protein
MPLLGTNTIKQCGHLGKSDLLAGVCILCGRALCDTCNVEYSVHQDFETKGFPRLNSHIREIIYHQRPELRSRAICIICQPCISEIETEYMTSYPYEDLPLLINHVWYGTLSHQLYKDRLSRKVP